MPDAFSQKEVNELFRGTPSRTIRFWVERGLVQVAGSVKDGRGEHRLYSRESLVQLAVVEILMGLNFSLSRTAQIMEQNFHGRQAKGKIKFGWSKGALEMVNAITMALKGSDPLASQEVALTINVDVIAKRINRLADKL